MSGESAPSAHQPLPQEPIEGNSQDYLTGGEEWSRVITETMSEAQANADARSGSDTEGNTPEAQADELEELREAQQERARQNTQVLDVLIAQGMPERKVQQFRDTMSRMEQSEFERGKLFPSIAGYAKFESQLSWIVGKEGEIEMGEDPNFEQGDTVSVQRTSGDTEHDWVFMGVSKQTGEVIVAGEDNNGQRMYKTMPAERLAQMNGITSSVESEGDTREVSVDTEGEPVVTNETNEPDNTENPSETLETPESVEAEDPELEALLQRGEEALNSSVRTRAEVLSFSKDSMNAITHTIASLKNTVSTPKNVILRWRRDRAQAKADRANAKVGSSMFKFRNRRFQKKANLAQRNLRFKQNTLYYHDKKIQQRIDNAGSRAQERQDVYDRKMEIYRAEKQAAAERKATRQLRREKRQEGMGYIDRSRAMNNLTDEDKRRITELAIGVLEDKNNKRRRSQKG